jgi:hypothetical protein
MPVKYTCGTPRDVRGNCGRLHRTIRGAARCALADQRACKRQGGYSDRKLVVIGKDGFRRRPTEAEYFAWEAACDKARHG